MSDDDYEPEEISNSEKLQIAQHFLLSSPPGQFDEVLSSVRVLLPQSLLTPEMLGGIARAYNSKHSSLVTLDGGGDEGKCFLVSKEGELDPTHYIDSRNKRKVLVDHIKMVGTTDLDHPLPPSAFDSGVEGKRGAVQKEVDNYVQKHFIASGGRASAQVFSKGGVITIVIAGDKINLRNCWSGSWTSTWTLDGSNQLSGSCKVRAHYFEEGNVQLNTVKDFPMVTVSGEDAALGAAVAKQITENEQQLHLGLESMYANMSEETLKNMRRVMPITRTKMEWNLAAHALVKNLHTNK